MLATLGVALTGCVGAQSWAIDSQKQTDESDANVHTDWRPTQAGRWLACVVGSIVVRWRAKLKVLGRWRSRAGCSTWDTI
ncbi:hypothetical protein BX600DRAFT_472065 [Xylariales sp. PMI_506]|nr:hypothetical protein BX600DRAFT_472065 [Xylariales sp. PMI_506]